MNREELLGRRMAAQCLSGPETSRAPEETVTRLGAVQAQDSAMTLWAVAVRTPGNSPAQVCQAIDDGRLVRTHILRPTWHLLAAKDLRWMLDLTGPRISRAAETWHRQTGLSADVRSRARKVVEKALAEGPKTREELMVRVGGAGLPVGGHLPSHYLMDAEIAGLVCSGPRRDTATTYDLMDRRIPPASPLPGEDMLAMLARRYITGHGPATHRDFGWWAGMPLSEAKKGLESCSPALGSVVYEGETYWFDREIQPSLDEGFRWLPAFDEYLIAYTDRTAALDLELQPRAFTKNGIFNPVVLHRGRVAGVWKKKETAHAVSLTVDWLDGSIPGAEDSRKAWEETLTRNL